MRNHINPRDLKYYPSYRYSDLNLPTHEMIFEMIYITTFPSDLWLSNLSSVFPLSRWSPLLIPYCPGYLKRFIVLWAWLPPSFWWHRIVFRVQSIWQVSDPLVPVCCQHLVAPEFSKQQTVLSCFLFTATWFELPSWISCVSCHQAKLRTQTLDGFWLEM